MSSSTIDLQHQRDAVNRDRLTASRVCLPLVDVPPDVVVEPIECRTIVQSIGTECRLRCSVGMTPLDIDQRLVCSDELNWIGAVKRGCVNYTSGESYLGGHTASVAKYCVMM